jgi:hypothetical protein
VLCAEYLCGYLAEGGEDGVLVRRVSRLAARYTVIKINAYAYTCAPSPFTLLCCCSLLS